jgi:hypothetical protein
VGLELYNKMSEEEWVWSYIIKGVKKSGSGVI